MPIYMCMHTKNFLQNVVCIFVNFLTTNTFCCVTLLRFKKKVYKLFVHFLCMAMNEKIQISYQISVFVRQIGKEVIWDVLSSIWEKVHYRYLSTRCGSNYKVTRALVDAQIPLTDKITFLDRTCGNRSQTPPISVVVSHSSEI